MEASCSILSTPYCIFQNEMGKVLKMIVEVEIFYEKFLVHC